MVTHGIAAEWVPAEQAAEIANRNVATVLLWMRNGELERKTERVRGRKHQYYCKIAQLLELVKKKDESGTAPIKCDNRPGDDATEEEVERCVAEQMQCLPDWWDDDTRKMNRSSIETLVNGKL